jgi:hypothetical protein
MACEDCFEQEGLEQEGWQEKTECNSFISHFPYTT